MHQAIDSYDCCALACASLAEHKGSVPFCLPRRAQRNSGVTFWASKK